MWLIGLLAGCTSYLLYGEQAAVTLVVEDLTAGPMASASNSTPILEGTRFCVRPCRHGTGGPFQEDCADEDAIHACYAQRAEGDAVLDGDCLTLGEAGEVDWVFEWSECGWDLEEPLEDDSVPIHVVAAEGLVARPVRTIDEYVLDALWAAAEDEEVEYWVRGAPLPQDVRTAPGEVLRVIVGGSVTVEPTLETPEGARVGRHVSQTLGVQGDATWDAETAALTPQAGSTGPLSLDVGTHSFPAGSWVSVPEDEVASLELSVLGYVEEGMGVVMGARVTARDAEGALLDGAPVSWSQRGDPIAPTPYASDVYTLNDACVPQEERLPGRATILEVSLGELSHAVRFTWDEAGWGEGEQVGVLPSAFCPPPPSQEEDDEPPGQCGCASPGTGLVVAWAPLLVGLLLRRRQVAGS